MELFSEGCHTSGSSSTTDSGCISSVDFGENYITSEGILHFLNIPQHILRGITELSLTTNELDANTCDLLAKAVPEMPLLEVLDFYYNPTIGNGGAVSLIRSLYTSKVKTLMLSDTGIGEEDCECLSELSKSNHYLECLTVEDNNLSSESVEMITRGVAHGSSLRILDMSRNQFSVAAVVNLASLLSEQSDCKLEELYLLDCNMFPTLKLRDFADAMLPTLIMPTFTAMKVQNHLMKCVVIVLPSHSFVYTVWYNLCA